MNRNVYIGIYLIVFIGFCSMLVGLFYLDRQATNQANYFLAQEQNAQTSKLNIDERLTKLEYSVNQYLGTQMAKSDVNDLVDRYNELQRNIVMNIPDVNKKMGYRTNGEYYPGVAYLNVFAYGMNSQYACSVAMHEVGHHRWHTELTDDQKADFNNDTEEYARWFSGHFPCDTNIGVN